MRKFKHYAFEAVIALFGTSVAGLIVYTIYLAIIN
jgi:hypothetical protein